jgi:hypothetical protein
METDMEDNAEERLKRLEDIVRDLALVVTGSDHLGIFQKVPASRAAMQRLTHYLVQSE